MQDDDSSKNSKRIEQLLDNENQSNESLCILDSDRKLKEEDSENIYFQNYYRKKCNDLIEYCSETHRLIFYRLVSYL